MVEIDKAAQERSIFPWLYIAIAIICIFTEPYYDGFLAIIIAYLSMITGQLRAIIANGVE